MTSELLRIDPALPVCWQDLDTLRIGFEEAVATLPHPTPVQQRVMAALRTGVVDARIAAQRQGVAVGEFTRVIEQVAPALIRDSAQGESPHTEHHAAECVIARHSATTTMVNAALQSGGATVVVLNERLSVGGEGVADWRFARNPSPQQVLISVAEYLRAPTPAELRLAEQLPQLILRFTDRAVWVGPWLTPQGPACAQCVNAADIAADPLLPVLAAQLVAHTPASVTQLSVQHIASVVLTTIAHHATGASTPLTHGRLRFAVTQGLPSLTPTFHPLTLNQRCECFTVAPHEDQPQR